jgi:tetratricopeptide (TPR) repeat protein
MTNIKKTGDVDQNDNHIAIAHTGTGNITIQVGDAHSPVVSFPLGGPGGASSPAHIRHALPSDIPEFTGRNDELKAVLDIVRQGVGVGRPVVVCVIDGMPGVGKTALAVHAAHCLVDQFPDGQLVMPLNAHTAGRSPVKPSDALSALLRQTGMAPGEIPHSIEEKENEWRSRLVGKRVLILLDDAITSEQVRSLLPGEGGCAVLVTTRHRLETFGGVELDVLEPHQAVHLLLRLSGRGDTEPEAALELIALAGRLPLAIQLLAGYLRRHPLWTIGDLTEDLGAAQDRSAKIRAIDQSVSSAFDLSYNSLPLSRRQFFRRLGLHPGTDVDAYEAAALSALDLEPARQELEVLHSEHMIVEYAKGHFRFHDLLRDYARALAAMESLEEQSVSIRRLCDYYLHAAQAANLQLARRSSIQLDVESTPPRNVPSVSTRGSAASWMEARWTNLHAVVEYSAEHDLPHYTTAIAAAMAGFLRTSGHWVEAMTLHNKALAAARSAADLGAEASALHDLGTIQYCSGDYAEAAASQRRARELYRATGSQLGEANALNELGAVQYITEKYGAALVSLLQAVELHRTLNDRLGEANAHNRLGAVRHRLGDYAEATAAQMMALELYRALGNELGEASATHYLGAIQCDEGHYDRAALSQIKALELYRETGDRLGEANTLNALSKVFRYLGKEGSAQNCAWEAEKQYRELGDHIGRDDAARFLNVIGFNA